MNPCAILCALLLGFKAFFDVLSFFSSATSHSQSVVPDDLPWPPSSDVALTVMVFISGGGLRDSVALVYHLVVHDLGWCGSLRSRMVSVFPSLHAFCCNLAAVRCDGITQPCFGLLPSVWNSSAASKLMAVCTVTLSTLLLCNKRSSCSVILTLMFGLGSKDARR